MVDDIVEEIGQENTV